MCLKVQDDEGLLYASYIFAAYQYAMDMGAQIIVNSFSNTYWSVPQSPPGRHADMNFHDLLTSVRQMVPICMSLEALISTVACPPANMSESLRWTLQMLNMAFPQLWMCWLLCDRTRPSTSLVEYFHKFLGQLALRVIDPVACVCRSQALPTGCCLRGCCTCCGRCRHFDLCSCWK